MVTHTGPIPDADGPTEREFDAVTMRRVRPWMSASLVDIGSYRRWVNCPQQGCTGGNIVCCGLGETTVVTCNLCKAQITFTQPMPDIAVAVDRSDPSGKVAFTCRDCEKYDTSMMPSDIYIKRKCCHYCGSEMLLFGAVPEDGRWPDNLVDKDFEIVEDEGPTDDPHELLRGGADNERSIADDALLNRMTLAEQPDGTHVVIIDGYIHGTIYRLDVARRIASAFNHVRGLRTEEIPPRSIFESCGPEFTITASDRDGPALMQGLLDYLGTRPDIEGLGAMQRIKDAMVRWQDRYPDEIVAGMVGAVEPEESNNGTDAVGQ